MMPKRVAIVLVLSLCMMLTACSPGGQTPVDGVSGALDPKNPVTVTLWHYYIGENQQMIESAVSDFNQTMGVERGVIVEPVALGSIAELEKEVTASAMGVINAQPMPQIFSSYPDKALEIDKLDMIVDLGDYFTEEEKGQYIADFLRDGIFEGDRMMLAPVVKSTELLYVNDTGWNEFAEASGWDSKALATWEGVYDAAKAYYDWTASPDEPWSGKSFLGFDSVANYVIIGNKQLGVDIISTEENTGEAVLDRAVLRKVFEPYYKGISLGYFDAVGKFRSDDIKAGELIAYVGSSSSAAYFPTWIEKDNTQADIDFLALAYPVFDGGTQYAVQQGAGMCIGKSTPAQQEGAALFLKWFTDPAQNIPFAMTTGYLPVQTAAYTAEAFGESLDALREGDKADQNVAKVYDISLHQIQQSNTYAAKPFEGSYSVRSILQSTLIDAALAGRDIAALLQAQGKTEEEIIDALALDTQFDQWIETIVKQLEQEGVACREV